MFAEECNYWKTGKSSPDVWLARCRQEIEAAGGLVQSEAFGQQLVDGEDRAAYMLTFQFGDDQFKAIWPVLPSKTGNIQAAKIQAATMLYPDVKARAVSAKVLGIRGSFMGYLLLPNGQTASQSASHDLARYLPPMLGSSALLLPAPKGGPS